MSSNKALPSFFFLLLISLLESNSNLKNLKTCFHTIKKNPKQQNTRHYHWQRVDQILIFQKRGAQALAILFL